MQLSRAARWSSSNLARHAPFLFLPFTFVTIILTKCRRICLTSFRSKVWEYQTKDYLTLALVNYYLNLRCRLIVCYFTSNENKNHTMLIALKPKRSAA